ncbi:hypothetical protein RQP46_001438 [Phenoliferia psychrophenolica]
MRKIDRKAYDVTVVSQNTYFAFTPLLASTAVGTLEFRCALEPVRRYGDQVASYQAWCNAIDFEAKTLECLPSTAGTNRFPGSSAPEDGKVIDPKVELSFPGTKPFKLGYDKLVIACGAYSQTFNTPGVKEYAHFLKDVKDARKIRSRILECFEQAAQPTVNDQERKNLLHFVIVGGGPTGIEFAAELHDLLATDMLRHYPNLAPMARITVYDVAPKILAAFDGELVEYAVEQFKRQGVIEVKEEGTIPFGMLVWSTGLAPNPLVESLKELKHDPKTQRYGSSFNQNGILANQQAKYVAKLLNAEIKQRPTPDPFEFKSAGIMTYVGNWLARKMGAQSQKKLVVSHGFYGAQLIGPSLSLGVRNKASLGFYWFLNWTFGRDITRF